MPLRATAHRANTRTGSCSYVTNYLLLSLGWPCLALPCLAWPCLALPCLALPALPVSLPRSRSLYEVRLQRRLEAPVTAARRRLTGCRALYKPYICRNMGSMWNSHHDGLCTESIWDSICNPPATRRVWGFSILAIGHTHARQACPKFTPQTDEYGIRSCHLHP